VLKLAPGSTEADNAYVPPLQGDQKAEKADTEAVVQLIQYFNQHASEIEAQMELDDEPKIIDLKSPVKVFPKVVLTIPSNAMSP